MSEYLSSLDPVARGRYLKRLEVLGLKENDDPYTEENSGRFIDDIASWPPIEYGHIFFNFVERSGVSKKPSAIYFFDCAHAVLTLKTQNCREH